MSSASSWLLLRGLGREVAHWDRFPDVLSSQGHRVELLDLQGAGTEFARPAPLSISAYVEDLRARRGTREPVGLIAISLGGMVALEWAARYPTEITRLVIINSSVSGLVPPWKRLRLDSIRTGIRFIAASTLAEKERAALEITTSLQGAALEEKVRQWVAIRQHHPVKTTSVLRQLVAAFRFKLDGQPSCPVLVVQGAKDRMVDPICSELLATKLGAKLVTHPAAGHDLPLEEPEWLARTVTEWAGA